MEILSLIVKAFTEVTGQRFRPDNLDDKIIAQKIVFLLKELGIQIGNYQFDWGTYGPFSQSLHNDINELSNDDVVKCYDYALDFNERTQQRLHFLHDMFLGKPHLANCKNYSDREWMETIGSCVFVKNYEYPSLSFDDIIENVRARKSYLNDTQANSQAVVWCRKVTEYNYS